MKILFFADLHARKTYRNLSSQGILEDILNTIEEIAEIADQEKVAAIFSLGDLFHKVGTISVELLSRIYSAFRDLERFQLYFLVGNHDLSGKYTVLEPFKELGKVIEIPEMLELGGKSFFCYPFNRGTFMWEEADVFLGHIALAEGTLDATDMKLKEEISVKELRDFFEIGLLGHYHRYQSIGNYHYVGSALQLSFGETGQKKLCVILDTESLKLKWVQLKKARKYKILEYDPENLFSPEDYEDCIVKLKVPSDFELTAFNGNIPIGCEYFIEKSLPETKIETRLEGNLEIDALIRKFLELVQTDLNKDSLEKWGFAIIEKAKEQEIDVGI